MELNQPPINFQISHIIINNKIKVDSHVPNATLCQNILDDGHPHIIKSVIYVIGTFRKVVEGVEESI